MSIEDLERIPLGTIYAHRVTFAQALDCVEELVRAGRGGYVVTPNVDHVVMADVDPELRAVYDGASLSLVDGMPLLWLSRMLGRPFPEKVSGSDLVRPLMERAAQRGWRVFFLGAAPGIADKAAQILCAEYPNLQIVGTYSPPLGFERDPTTAEQTLELVSVARADIALFALGCPKQELLMHRWRSGLGSTVALGIGATLDFIAGHVRRAPSWMSNAGLEWVYRLTQDPRRLAHRYLVRDRAIVGIAWRMFRGRSATEAAPSR